MNPNAADAYVYRGMTYHNTGEYERAVADFDRALAIDPNHQLALACREDSADR